MIYLDNAGTTKVLPECLKIYEEYQEELFYNPSAPYHESLELSLRIQKARESILKALRADADDRFLFTSSGTESDNMVLFGTKKRKNARIVVSESEHPAVYNAALQLKNQGYDVVFCPVDETGRVILDQFRQSVTETTDLVSIMHVNNETGCVNDIKTLCKIAKEANPDVFFHSDGVQAVGKIDVSLRDLGVDAYSVSGHKIHSVKGVAGLYLKRGAYVKPLLYGGGQELGLRSSTENVGGILSFAYAVRKSVERNKEEGARIKMLRDDLKTFFIEKGMRVVDSGDSQSPYILCAVMPRVRGEVMLHSLEKYGVLIGTGSACSSKKTHKRLPMILCLTPEYENGVIRISFSDYTQKEEINCFKKCFNLEYELLKKYIS